MIVHPLEASELTFAARLHREALPSGFFADLGEGFLREYYRTFVDSPHGVGLVAEVDGEPVGVLVGTVDNRLHWAWAVRQHGWRLGLRGAIALARRPQLAWWFLRTRTRRYLRALLRFAGISLAQPAEEESAPTDVMTIAVLKHVGVVEQERGSGVGAELVSRFATARERRRRRRRRVGDAGRCRRAGAFYRRLGWQHRRDRTGHDGVGMSEYVLDLRPEGSREAVSGA